MKYSVKTEKILGTPPVENIYDPDVCVMQVYILDYYGVIVAFEVGKVMPEKIKLVELELHPYEDGWMISREMKLAKKTWFVKKNVRTKSEFEVKPIEGGLVPIIIKYTSPIYTQAILNGHKNPEVGIFFAERVDKWWDKYWRSLYSDIIDEDAA